MKKKRLLSFFLLLCLTAALFVPLALAEAPEEGQEPEPLEEVQPSATPAPPDQKLEGPTLSAQAVYLVDLDSGYPLYSLDSGYPRSPASLTKVMTVLLALEAVDRGEASLDDVVTAGLDCQNGMSDDSSSVYIVAGEQMTLRDLLYCAAVSSGNDACNVIASYLGNGIPNFVERMNARAAELGCRSTRFVDPNGLSNDNLTCAYDLYLITRAAMGYPDFMEICDTTAYTVAATNLNPARELKNSNALISAEGIYGPGYLYEGAHGIKTGYTRAAGYCLISTAERDGMRLLAVGLGLPLVYFGSFFSQVNLQVARHNLDKPRPVYTVYLDGSGIRVTNDQREEAPLEVSWKDAQAAFRAKGCIYLYINAQRAFLLPEGQCDADAVWAFLKRNMAERCADRCRKV